MSCDSFDEEKNFQIGRHQSGKGNLKCLQNVRDWCKKYHVAFKINTVVNVYNVGEDMNENIRELDPIRWKVSNKYGLLTKCRCKIERFLFECRKVISFAITTLRDWLKRFAPLFHPIRSKTKNKLCHARMHFPALCVSYL